MGLCDAQNFPILVKRTQSVEEIGISEAENSIFLKSIPYSEMYQELIRNKIYNVKLIDGAMIYMLYRFIDGKITAHRLSYFPAPDLKPFQSEPDLYLEDEIYLDIIDERVVTVPFRFDYDNTEGVHRPVEHPISHFTLGQYENCRIPVSAPVTPFQFVSFVIRNFYHTVQTKYEKELKVYKKSFERCILKEEEKVMYVCVPE